MSLPEEITGVGNEVYDSAFKVHRTLGPGLLESSYKVCLCHELELRGLSVELEVPVPLIYEGLKLEKGYRLDMLINDVVIVEAKAVEVMHPICQAQLITYLRLTGKRLGYLINFNVPLIRDGIRRYIC